MIASAESEILSQLEGLDQVDRVASCRSATRKSFWRAAIASAGTISVLTYRAERGLPRVAIVPEGSFPHDSGGARGAGSVQDIPFLDHLDELRQRILRSMLVITASTVIGIVVFKRIRQPSRLARDSTPG